MPRLHIASSTMDLSGLELELGTTRGRAFRLRDAIAALNKNAAPETDYTYVLIDCPPSLNLLTVNAMAAADAILVPLQCEFFALEGLSQLLQTVEQVRLKLNPNFDPRHRADHVRLAQQSVEPGRRRRAAVMGDKVYNTMIPRNVRISEAPSHGKPALVYDLQCAGSQAYMKLATEVIQRERDLRGISPHDVIPDNPRKQVDPESRRDGAKRFEIPGSRLTKRPGMTERSTEFQFRSSGGESRELAAMADETRSRLGRGLASLIGDVGGEAAKVERPRSQRKVPIEFLKPNPRNPRGPLPMPNSTSSASLDPAAWRHPADRGAAPEGRAGSVRDRRRRTALGARRSSPA